MPVGSIPTSVTDKESDPVVQGQRRLGDNQESDGWKSIRDHYWSWSPAFRRTDRGLPAEAGTPTEGL